MVRIATPWTRDRRNRRYWYVTVNYRQILLNSCDLGDDLEAAELAAKRAYYRMMGQDRPVEVIDTGATPSLSELCGAFLDWSEACVSKWTHYNYRRYCRSFCHAMPLDPLASDIRPSHVEQWVASANVGTSAAWTMMTAVKRCYAWAFEQGFLSTNPLTRLKKPKPSQRKSILGPKDAKRLLAKAGTFRDALVVLMEQGIRPAELRMLEARHLVGDSLELPPTEHKTGKATGTNRIVHLTKTTKAIVTRLAKRYPTGPLFRGRYGMRWTKDGMARHFAKIRKAAGVSDSVTLYSIRHTYATDALVNGTDVATLAGLMGHTNPAMLLRVYQHVLQRPEHMREAAERSAIRLNRGAKPKTASRKRIVGKRVAKKTRRKSAKR